MAESAKSMPQKASRRKRFKKFNENALKNCFQSDQRLQTILSSFAAGRQVWRQLTTTDDSEDDDQRQEFQGFGEASAPPPECASASPASANRIQELLQRRWAQRIRELNDQKSNKEEKKSEIIRKAKLEINSKTLQRIRRAHEWPQTSRSAAEPSRSGQPGYITCAICAATKYYAHVQRRYGVFSCEPCSKFFARFIKEPKQFFCARTGDCPIGPRSSESRNVSGSRCRACWLKVCLQKFQMDAELRLSISSAFAPQLVGKQMALITVDTTTDTTTATTQVTTTDTPLLMVAASGPRVKRVCRSAGIVSGLPVATFRAASGADEDSDELPVDVYLCRKVAEKRRKGLKCERALKLEWT